MNFGQAGEQLCLAEEFTSTTAVTVKRPSLLPDEASTPIRHALEKRYRKVLVERRDYRQLVTYVPNKNLPIYNWFRYKEGFSRQLVLNLAAKFGLEKGDAVYDPFAGCGTTLLSSKELGLTAIGTDMLPVAVFASQVKISKWPEPSVLSHAVGKLLHAPFKTPIESLPQIPIIDLAFSAEVQEQILFFKEQIDAFELPVRNFMMLGLLSILESVSTTSKDGQFLRLVEKTIPKPREVLRTTLMAMIDDLSSTLPFIRKLRGNGKVSAILGDARELCLSQRLHGKIDAVITSPPYLNRYDYTRSYALELCLMSIKNHHEMVKLRHSLLRSHIESRNHENKEVCLPALDEILTQLNQKVLNNNRLPIMVKAYFEDMNLVIRNLATYLKPGGKVALVVANAQFAGESVPTDFMLSELATQHGFQTDEIWITRYKGNSSQQMAIYGRRPVRESIVFWRKNV